jgi:hypothetical protein
VGLATGLKSCCPGYSQALTQLGRRYWTHPYLCSLSTCLLLCCLQGGQPALSVLQGLSQLSQLLCQLWAGSQAPKPTVRVSSSSLGVHCSNARIALEDLPSQPPGQPCMHAISNSMTKQRSDVFPLLQLHTTPTCAHSCSAWVAAAARRSFSASACSACLRASPAWGRGIHPEVSQYTDPCTLWATHVGFPTCVCAHSLTVLATCIGNLAWYTPHSPASLTASAAAALA